MVTNSAAPASLGGRAEPRLALIRPTCHCQGASACTVFVSAYQPIKFDSAKLPLDAVRSTALLPLPKETPTSYNWPGQRELTG